jgi:hypothetical protein
MLLTAEADPSDMKPPPAGAAGNCGPRLAKNLADERRSIYRTSWNRRVKTGNPVYWWRLDVN